MVGIALGWARTLAMVLASLAAHEWAHGFAARWCGARMDKPRAGLHGMAARVRNMDNLHPRLRLCVYSAGVAMNIALAVWAFTVHQLSYVGVPLLRDLAFYNAVLAGFNLLPILPLDGGRLAQHFLGNTCGILRANRFLLRFGRVIAALLMLAGVVQGVLFSFNITLLIAGIFLWRANGKLRAALRMEFYLSMQKKQTALCGERGKTAAKVKPLTIAADMPIARVLERLGWSYFRLFYVKSGDVCVEIHEAALLNYVFDDRNEDTPAKLAQPIAEVGLRL